MSRRKNEMPIAQSSEVRMYVRNLIKRRKALS
jgi:hypothetical protein